ncbi:MAG TPA: tripartite tricarboxylate transporter permease [Calditerricola sp.]
METLTHLLHGFEVALTLKNLPWAVLGVTLGTAVGVLPGLGPAMTLALLLPLTFRLDPVASFIMFAGVYYGAMYGGSTTSILLNVPGESATMITALEGHKMALKGRAGAALATAAIGSFVAGTIATVGLTFLAPVMVKIALLFGPAEYFALMVLAFATVSALLGRSLVRGMTSLLLGVGLGLVGIDLQTGQARFTLGFSELLDGIDDVIVLIGLFAVGEALYVAAFPGETGRVLKVRGSLWMTREELRRSWKAWLRGTVIGFPFGALPAGGAELPTLLSYSVEKSLSRHKEEFGEGAIEGVAGPEAANNASVTGTMVPLLTLGLPTSATAAIMLVAFQQYGLQPGPLLFEQNADLVWGMIASFYIGNALLLVLNLPLIGLWVRLLEIPQHWLYAGILVFAGLGAYSLNGSVGDVVILFAVGLLGFLMRRFDYPLAPTLIGMILGPMAEQQFRRALAVSQGDFTVFFTHPISAGLLAVALLMVVVPSILRYARTREAAVESSG